MHPVTLIAVASASVGLSLIAVGLRGRRLDRLPRCRGCLYDLTGVSSDRCPECGRSVSRRRAVRTGVRRRRPVCLSLGLIALAFLVLPVIWWNAGRAPIGSRPAWRLLADVRLMTPGSHESAAELRRRWEQGELSRSEEQAFIAGVVSSWADHRYASPLRDPDLFETGYIYSSFSRDQLRAVFEAAMDELRDDEVVGNAAQGEKIVNLLAPIARPAIREALMSDDAQQALRAARIMEATSDTASLDDPPPALLVHAAAALQTDSEWANAREGERVLRSSGEQARAALEAAIYSEDPLQSFKAARLLSSLPVNEEHHPRLLELAIEALRDDDIQHNSWWGEAYISSNARASDLARLERSLTSGDAQQRAMIADDLVWVHRRLGVPPGRVTLDVWVSNLRLDAPGELAPSMTGLLEHIDLAEPLLRKALASPDPCQRFAAACLLAWDQRLATDDPVIDALVAQLADNDVHGDSALAAAALYRLGEPARDALTRALESDDVQRRNEAAEILWAWTLKQDKPQKYLGSLASYAGRVWFPTSP